MSQTPLFRIGGVYRQRKGDLVRLEKDSWRNYYECVAREVEGYKFSRGARRLSDGKAYPYETDESAAYDLLPGELTFVDGEWKSASELFIVDSKTPTLDKMEAESEEAFDAIYKGFLEVLAKNKSTEPIGDDYDEGDDWRAPEPTRPALDKMKAEQRGTTQEAGIADLAKRIQEHRSAERHRAPLDWNKPAPFDPFKGYEVTSHSANEPQACGLHSPDLKQSSHQVEAVFGSAELVRR